jgi:hypothetical protein
MNKFLLLGGLALTTLGVSTNSFGQQRYLDEVFTDSQIEILKDQTYGTNVDFLKNLSLLDPTYLDVNQVTIGTEMVGLKEAFANGTQIAPAYYAPYAADSSTIVKVSDMKMDIYMPKASEDTVSERPVMLYVHTGNFLPPVVNGGPNGSKEDSTAVELCKQWAKRGYVAIAANYRGGWNPVADGATGALVRRATLLNAVYRAIHDMKQVVRVIREDSENGNQYAIDRNFITLYGQGSGGYVSVAYNTLDKSSEMALPKFTNPLTGASFISEAVVGNVNGEGGLLNMYFGNGQPVSIQACINAGGALADISWLEGTIEAPMMSFHAVRDAFAPFDTGTVIVPNTGEDVVDVNGANMFIAKAVALGVNDYFKDSVYTDAYSVRAASLYGQSFSGIPTINVNDPIVINQNADGLFALDLPMAQGSPWEWWSKTDLDNYVAAINQVTGGNYNSNDIHNNALLSNQLMSKAHALTYIDSIQGYIHPRLMNARANTPDVPSSVREVSAQNTFKMYPNPASTQVTISSNEGLVKSVQVFDITGKLVITNQSNSVQVTLNIENLPNGIFLVQVQTNQGIEVEKLIIE